MIAAKGNFKKNRPPHLQSREGFTGEAVCFQLVLSGLVRRYRQQLAINSSQYVVGSKAGRVQKKFQQAQDRPRQTAAGANQSAF